MKVTYYVASSIDGYIAREHGDVSWLDALDISPEESGYEDFFKSIDALVMGRNTYDFIVAYGEWPYGDKPAWVCSTREVDPMSGCNLQNGRSPQEVFEEAKALGVKHLWLVGGGEVAAAFLQLKVVTHLSISHMPIILGGGIKLFGDLSAPVNIRQECVEVMPSGFLQLDYIVEYD